MRRELSPLDSPEDRELDRRIRELGSGVPSADEETTAAARRALQAEIRTGEKGARRRLWPRDPSRRLLAVVLVLVGGSGALALGNEIRQSVFRSDSNPPIYSISPLDPEAAEELSDSLGDRNDDAPVTTGDLDYCLNQETDDRVDAGCAVVLEAYRSGDLEPVPGPISILHVVPCGQTPSAGEVRSCGGKIRERDVQEALP